MYVPRLLVCALCLSASLVSARQDRPLAHARKKRHLIFPQGSNVQLVYCLTIGAYGRPGDLVMGLTAALAWELPSKAEERLAGLLHRSSRAVMYPKIEAFLQSTGLDGRACVLKALCEAGRRAEEELGAGSFLQELLHAVFTLRKDGTAFENEEHKQYDYAHSADGYCDELYPSCEHSIYDLDF